MKILKTGDNRVGKGVTLYNVHRKKKAVGDPHLLNLGVFRRFGF